MAATCEIVVIEEANSNSFTPPSCWATCGTVGSSVGITTPLLELNQLIIPEVSPITAAALLALISETSTLESTSIPPRSIISCIKTPTPVISSSVFQGMCLIALLSSETRKKDNTAATAKLTSPTLIRKSITISTITTIPAIVVSCLLLKQGTSFFCSTAAERSL